MNCVPEDHAGGRRCKVCFRPMSAKYPNARRNCIAAPGDYQAPRLPSAIRAAAESVAATRGMLLGDLIAAMTTAIGIPPCGGCEKRKAWLNRAHLWLLGRDQ